jgi:hypothetical protein
MTTLKSDQINLSKKITERTFLYVGPNTFLCATQSIVIALWVTFQCFKWCKYGKFNLNLYKIQLYRTIVSLTMDVKPEIIK